MRVPADPAWIMARVVALLTPYFTANIPESVRRMEAEDWLEALRGYPHWAIEKAVRWWKGEDNPNRHRKPLEGDIADKAKEEMGILTIGHLAVTLYDRGYITRMSEPEREPISPEDMDRRRQFAQDVMQRAGFAKPMRPTGPRREDITDEDRAEAAAILAKYARP